MVVAQHLHIACRAVQRSALKRFSALERHRGALGGRTLKRLQGAQEADQVGAILVDNIRKGRHARRRKAIVQEPHQFVIGTQGHPFHDRRRKLAATRVGAMARCTPGGEDLLARGLG